MRTLPKPNDDVGDVLTLCTSRIRDRDLRTRLQSIAAAVRHAAAQYDAAALNRTLHEIPRRAKVTQRVTADEMIRTYTTRLVPKKGPGRVVYDRLISAAPLGRCPLCGIGQVVTLDHHLPKAHYPALALTPVNLVPSCQWCQSQKKESFPRTAEQQTLHPYYDDFEGQRWLTAVVVEGAPAAFKFAIVAPEGADRVSLARMRHHFRTFNLDVLYASNAGEELLNIRDFLQTLFDFGGETGVRDQLRFQATSRAGHQLNSWQTAMYVAASESDWFCREGFAAA